MQSVTSTIIIILIACLMPYAFAVVARIGAGFKPEQHGEPRTFMVQITGWPARIYAAQQNSFEGLPLFLAAMLMAEYLLVPRHFILQLGVAYLILRMVYAVCYMANLSRLRSIIWLLATTCPVLLLMICIKFYAS